MASGESTERWCGQIAEAPLGPQLDGARRQVEEIAVIQELSRQVHKAVKDELQQERLKRQLEKTHAAESKARRTQCRFENEHGGENRLRRSCKGS